MTITELLEAHVQHDAVAKSTQFYCLCGWVSEAPRYGEGRVEHRAHVAEVIEQHMQEREAEAVRETSRYLQRIFLRKGLVNRACILADMEIAADRISRGMHANGRDKETSNGR